MSEFPNPHAVGINRHASLSGTPSSPKKVKTPPVGKKIKPPPSSENENSSLNLQSLSPSSLLSLSTSRAFAPPPKPFKCPVPGCEKSYKQMNGLKYHRIHGHCNATVTVPMDGVTGGEGDIELPYDVEESKPFMCHQGGCGKRYKNMNGLRYHYSHSGPHGQLGLQLLNTGSHPPPQYPSGYIPPRHPNANVSNQSSRTGSRTTSESPPPSMDRKGSQMQM
ncbi:hypothetical protein BT69DRAFT_911645 [Atractiella rhizophila]|nr:hypothetical protein BT69DRAFT_911645 [Atractiella rhizophila]